MDLTAEQLHIINQDRDGRNYFDTAAATEVHGSAAKQSLTESPFLRRFEFGGSNGYWNGSHMVVQTEDCINCLKILYPQFDYIFLFDHSSGHAKKRANGLNVTSMNKGYGGENNMRSTIIEKVEGYLGPYHDINNPLMAQVGQEQKLVYAIDADINNGPFNLSMQNKSLKSDDTWSDLSPDKVSEKDKTKKELIDDIMRTEVGRYEGENKLTKTTVRELRNIASRLEISTNKNVTQKLTPGWRGMGKGMLQILWERGWICEEELGRYRKKSVDDDGFLVKEYSLTHSMLGECSDFANELSQLEYVCSECGVEALITTKYHAEYAGEGIEYSWGAAKALYRRYPIYSKQGKENFLDLVSRCTSRDVLTTELIRKFSRRAWNYMLTYKSLEMVGENEG